MTVQFEELCKDCVKSRNAIKPELVLQEKVSPEACSGNRILLIKIEVDRIVKETFCKLHVGCIYEKV